MKADVCELSWLEAALDELSRFADKLISLCHVCAVGRSLLDDPKKIGPAIKPEPAERPSTRPEEECHQ